MKKSRAFATKFEKKIAAHIAALLMADKSPVAITCDEAIEIGVFLAGNLVRFANGEDR